MEDARLPSLKDKYREMTNQDIKDKTKEIKEETMKVKGKVAKKTK